MVIGLRLGKVLFVTSIVLLLLFSSFAATFILHDGGYQWRGSRDATWRGFVHQLGWVSFLLFIASNFYSILKRVSSKRVKTWLLIHCVLGIVSLVFACIHAIGGLWPIRSKDFLSLFAFLLMIVVVVSGILGRFVSVRFIKSYWKVLHVPLTVLFCLILIVHILDKLALL